MQDIEDFELKNGQILARKYTVIGLLGSGWEGQVYLVREISTGIERAIKLFFPQRNIADRAAQHYARKLHKLRHCPIAIHYYTNETITRRGQPITLLVSEYIEGEILSDFLARQKGKRLSAFQAAHLLHALASGIDCIHQAKEYHGDLHSGNIIVLRHGLGFELKLLDFFQWQAPRKENINDDVIDLIKIFYEAVGGRNHYAKQPNVVKNICRGLKRGLILKQYQTAGQLKDYLESMTWE